MTKQYVVRNNPVDLTVSKRPGTSYQRNLLFLITSFVSLYEICWHLVIRLGKKSLQEIKKQSKLSFTKNLVVLNEKNGFIFNNFLFASIFRVFRSSGCLRNNVSWFEQAFKLVILKDNSSIIKR